MASRVEQFETLLAGQPANVMFRFSLAQALLAERRPGDAVPHLEICAGERSDWMVARILLGKALLELGRPAEAKPWLAQALQLAVEQHHEDPEREVRALLADMPA
jgi:predicted Zn-dependent protease